MRDRLLQSCRCRGLALLVLELEGCQGSEHSGSSASEERTNLLGDLRIHIESRVWEFETGSRLGWFGNGKDVHAYHTFLLTKTPEGCHVVTEEVVKGSGAIQFREQQPSAMHEGHQLWLMTLKDRSEKH